ncbi:MAG: shikimate dehydrogenase family protein, partial [Candidatus Limnocylindrales bacterium]
LVRFFGRSAAHMELKAMPLHESVIEAELAKAKVLINASAVGLASGTSPIPAELLPPGLLVFDLIYTPRETRLLRDARAAGAEAVQNGELMLLHQGAAAFALWTGLAPSLDLMRERLDAAFTNDGPGNNAPTAGAA